MHKIHKQKIYYKIVEMFWRTEQLGQSHPKIINTSVFTKQPVLSFSFRGSKYLSATISMQHLIFLYYFLTSTPISQTLDIFILFYIYNISRIRLFFSGMQLVFCKSTYLPNVTSLLCCVFSHG